MCVQLFSSSSNSSGAKPALTTCRGKDCERWLRDRWSARTGSQVATLRQHCTATCLEHWTQLEPKVTRSLHPEVLVAHSRHRRSMRGVSSSRPCYPSGSRRSCSAGTGRAPPRRTKPAKPANSCVVRGSPGGASVVQWWWWSLWKWGGVDGARTVLPSCASDPLTRLVPPLMSGFPHR